MSKQNKGDDVVILSNNDDDDKTVFQTEEERKKLEKEIFGLNEDDSQFNLDMETTIQMTQMTIDPRPYWKKVFG